MRSHAKLLATVSLAITATRPAWAQDAPQEQPQQPPQDATTPTSDIVVTAQRREESLQDVPISITALSGDTLTAAGIQDTERLSTLTPGLLVQRSVVGKISIRGVGNENYTISGDPGVAVHSDGVYVARAAAGLFDLFDVARVEVLRGPQGTLYGRNATGGVINVIPNYPSDKFEGRVAAEYGNYDAFRVEGMVNAPLGGCWAVRIAGLGSWRDGFTRNTNASRSRGFDRLDSKDVLAGRGQIAYDGDSAFKARLSVEYLGDDSNLPAYKYLNRPDALPTADFGGGANAFDRRFRRTVNQGFELDIPGTNRTVGSDDDVFKTNQFGAALHMSYDFGGVTLSSISGYRSTQFNWLNDGDGSDVFYVNYIQQDDTDQYSQELQLSGQSGRFEWLIGGYYFHESGDSFIALPFPFGANLPFYILIDGTAKTRVLAGFGELRWQATDRLKVTLGARYSDEKRKARYRYEINFGTPFVANPDLSDTFNAFTPRLVVNYEATKDINLYASATRGFKSGGFNLLAIQPGFEPEKVWSYEAGFKSTIGGIATLNANVFYADYKDIQVGQIVNLSSVLTNAAAATLKGAEVELSVRPTDVFDLGATIAYLDAKYDKFCTGDPTQPAAPVSAGCDPANPIDLKDNRFPRAPKWTLTGTAAYTIPIARGGLTLRGDVRYQSKTFFTQFNRPLIAQKGYTIVNGRATWTAPDDRFSIGAFVNNVFDKTYFTEILESGAFNPQLVAQGYVAPPRTYGITAAVSF
ncbi:TonB-dependent receptor [Sphingomonas sp. SUN019]|uniref:TonB-dependent receptor n=1 Tax=Sphingomonas sp. SUN019 TaxID=2937788 RepID=UPI00216496C7|nr:TonB-dependent receptor [Sphingomonas sp. SUN019]UVO49678.1 TonB-dependent receptor [Sphingomonas sp. SUN019]